MQFIISGALRTAVDLRKRSNICRIAVSTFLTGDVADLSAPCYRHAREMTTGSSIGKAKRLINGAFRLLTATIAFLRIGTTAREPFTQQRFRRSKNEPIRKCALVHNAGAACLMLSVALTLVNAKTPFWAQTTAPASTRNAPGPVPVELVTQAMPRRPRDGSEQILMLLETVRDHPTAGAYNTLGALFAAAGQVNCAIPAFQISLRLDAKNWEAHYNLGLAFLSSGDQARATTELRAAIREKPDSATSHFALGTSAVQSKKANPCRS